ncbi:MULTISPECIES: GumC family protein [Leptolyngbya]|uniref:GumC family protein n=1 Tax=Leptolyngbya TaxID=47251 RepID=UPI0016875B2C|nr:tyrosine-protein kinase domain-containing protein [Leptolyngbya sp. FACHB-1624]MBD1859866.1 AAA family ATPase [Leptolyngbya sp. FACHB-1624]
MKKIALIASRHWKALLGLNAVVILGTVGAMLTTPKVWTAQAQLILPSSNGGNLDANLGTLGSYRNSDPSFSPQVNPLKIQEAILTSDAILEKAWAADPERDAANKPRNYGQFFEVTSLEQTSVMLLSVTGSSPDIAKQRAEAILNAYRQRLSELRQANNNTRDGFSQKQLEQAQRRLTEAQTALAQFKQSTGLVNNEEQTKGLVGTINTLEAAQAQVQAESQAARDRANTLATRLNLSPTDAVQALGLDQNEDYKKLRGKLTEAESTLDKLRSTFTDRSPQVQRAIVERDTLRNQLQQYVGQAAGRISANTDFTTGAEGRNTLIEQLVLAETNANGQQRQAEQLQQQIDQRQKILNQLPANQAKLNALQRQADVAEGVYKGLVAQTQQSNIDAFNAYPNIQELNAPFVDAKPSSPKKSLMAINALLASVIGSIALILLLEARNPLLTPKDLQALKFSLVARIPKLKRLAIEPNSSFEGEIEFQRVASAISLQPLKGIRLLIASAITGEGKTTVALQLAHALTELGFRVLLVDGDFRKAQLSHQLGYLSDRSVGDQVISLQPNLDFVPTMPQTGKIVDLVKRGRFERYLAVAESQKDYDYVLVDSAPVSSTSETALMAAIVPYVLFVVRPGISARNVVNNSLEQLTQHHAKLLGLVINGVEVQGHAYSYHSNHDDPRPYRLSN